MSTRKHSEHIDRRQPVTIPSARAISLRLAGILLAAALLTACSTGQAPEANQGQEADAQRTSVISDLQATRTWELVNSTPESTPEETPAP